MFELFPASSLSSSVVTTVWIGVIIVCFFNLRFGWVLSGLVVPGYLVPLMLIKPWSASVVIGEGVLTYFAAFFLSSVCSRLKLWTTFFGRDRFFLILLLSVVIRVFMDGILLPKFSEYLNERYHLLFDYSNNLHSFGLIVVALLANILWKPGFIRGIIPFFCTLLATYLIVRFGLMEYTNFSVSNLAYLYEDIAVSMLASPKTYILLLTTAFIASRMNLLYGWEYNGILIPSLIALLWYQPHKILVSFIEAIVILFIANVVLSLPVFKKITVEGARKILLFFNISYLYKFFIAYAILYFLPEKKISDYYAFGYLLPTLLALKMHEKKIFLRLIKPTLQVSLYGVAIGSLIGVTLTSLSDFFADIKHPKNNARYIRRIKNESDFWYQMEKSQVTLYNTKHVTSEKTPAIKELDVFQAGLRKIKEYINEKNEKDLMLATSILDKVEYDLLVFNNRYLQILEREPGAGRGMYAIDTRPDGSLLVEVPDPVDEWGAFETGIAFFKRYHGYALAVAGASKGSRKVAVTNVLTSFDTFFQTFHNEFSSSNTIQIRGVASGTSGAFVTGKGKMRQLPKSDASTTVWIKSSLPPGIPLAALKKNIGTLNIEWVAPPFRNVQRTASSSGFAELFFNREDILSLGFNSDEKSSLETRVSDQAITGYLKESLLSGISPVAEKGSDSYVVPELGELLFFDKKVLTPLISLIHQKYIGGKWSLNGQKELRIIARSASMLGYKLLHYQHKLSGKEYIVLTENAASPKRYWGTYVFKPGESRPILVEIPRPGLEEHVFEYGISLFERLNAFSLLIAGAHPFTNRDFSSDLIRMENKVSLYSLANQVQLREMGGEPGLVINCRGLVESLFKKSINADVLIAQKKIPPDTDSVNPLIAVLTQMIAKDGLKGRAVDGSPETAGYEVGGAPQELYLDESVNKGFVTLWVSAPTRHLYRWYEENGMRKSQMIALGIEMIETDLYQYLNNHKKSSIKNSLLKKVRDFARQYSLFNDIVALEKLHNIEKGYQIINVLDKNSQKSFLVLLNGRREVELLINPSPKEQTTVKKSRFALDKKSVSGFIGSNKAFLIFRG